MSSASVDVGAGWQRLDGRQDREVNNGRPVSRLTLSAGDGIVLRRAD
jgi:hypothetical protein